MAGIKKDPNKEYSENWGGYRGGGRKRKSEGGRVRLQLSLSIEQRTKIKELAKQANKDVSSFVLSKIFD